MRKWILLSAIILLVSSCITPTPIPITLNCPPPLALPTLTEYQAADMQRLSDETYEVLVTRDILLQERVKTLCTIIESTH